MKVYGLSYRDGGRLYTCVAALLYPESRHSWALVDSCKAINGGARSQGMYFFDNHGEDALHELWLAFIGLHAWTEVEQIALDLIHAKHPNWDPIATVNAAVLACIAAGEIGTAAAVVVDELRCT